MIEKYGVKNALQYSEIRDRASFRYQYDGRHFDSSPEIAFYIWLKDNGVEFEYQPNVKLKYVHNGKEHFYMPDFIIGGKLIEIKGD